MSVYKEVMNVFKNLNNYIFDCVDEFEEDLKKEIAWLECIENDIEEFHKTGMLRTSFTTITSQVNPETQAIEDSLYTDSSPLSLVNNLKLKIQSLTDLIKPTVEESFVEHDLESTRTTRAKTKAKQEINKTTDENQNKIESKKTRATKTKKKNKEVEENYSQDDVDKVKDENEVNKFNKSKTMSRSNIREHEDDEESQVKKRKVEDEIVNNLDVAISTSILANDQSHLISNSPFLNRTVILEKVTISKEQTNLNDVITDNEDIVEDSPLKPKQQKKIEQEFSLYENSSFKKQVHAFEKLEAATEATSKTTRSKATSNPSIGKENEVNKFIKSKTMSRSNIREHEDDEESQIKKRKVKDEIVNNLDVTISSPILANDQSHLISNSPLLNRTVILEKVTILKERTNLNDVMTDNEDIVEDSPLTPKQQEKVEQKFSLCENKSIKKRVHAFEKLGAATEATSKTTRSKVTNNPSIEKETLKMTPSEEIAISIGTPTIQNRLKHFQPSPASKISISVPIGVHTLNKAAISIKSSSLQMEFSGRKLRRKQAEALQKEEAEILVQTEEERKKCVERELQVQQGAIKKDMQSLKKKNKTAKKRAGDGKKVAEGKLNENGKFIPPYLKYEAPLLPGPDCYDSGDFPSNQKIKTLQWQQRPFISKTLQVMDLLKSYRKTFFFSYPRTPNLENIFPTIEPFKLKRTSSAIWDNTKMSINGEEN